MKLMLALGPAKIYARPHIVCKGGQARMSPRPRIPAEDGNVRERILKASREIFGRYSFKAASTRMVAKQAGVEHPMIHYYFGSKEKLFETMAADMYAGFVGSMETWLVGLERMSPHKGLALFIDRMLDYTLANPDALQIIALNMVHIGGIEEIPGYRYITLHMAKTKRLLEHGLPLRGTSREIEMFIYCFYSQMITLIGARSMHAQLLNMDPDGADYRAWVKEASLTLFLPWLKRLLAG